jgi:hypothetical protein
MRTPGRSRTKTVTMGICQGERKHGFGVLEGCEFVKRVEVRAAHRFGSTDFDLI